MNNKYINETIITDNYLSFIYGIVQLMEGKKVLLLRNTTQMGEMSHQIISRLEADYIKQIGSRWEVAPLCHLELYQRSYNYFFQYRHLVMSFGHSPFHNLCEFYRKMGGELDNGKHDSFFEQMMNDDQAITDFNEKFNMLILRVTAELFQTKNWSLITLDKLLNHSFEQLRPIIKSIVTSIEGSSFLEQFFYHLNTLFHFNTKNSMQKSDYYLLLIQLLSPRYYLDQQRLTDDLILLVEKLGGQFLHSKVVDWESQGIYGLKIQLNSFSGLYTTERVRILDNDPLFKQSYRLHHTKDIYLTYRSSFFYPNGVNYADFIDRNSYGVTSVGEYESVTWFIHFFEDHFEINFILPYNKGTHSTIIKDMLKVFLQEEFRRRFFKLSMVSLISIDALFTPYVSGNQKKVEVRLGEDGFKSSVVDYQGALVGLDYGTLSLLNNLTL